MELQVVGGKSAKVKVVEEIFACEFKEPLVHQLVTSYLAAGRQGTKAQKTRAEVRGGGRKPWKQKGTGRARAGTIRSPLWRGGGVTFAAKQRDFAPKLNKKMYKKAMASIFAELNRQGRLQVIENIELPAAKTRELTSKLKSWDLADKTVLIIYAGDNDNLNLAARNLYRINLCNSADVDPVQLVSHEKVLITVDALKKVEEKLS